MGYPDSQEVRALRVLLRPTLLKCGMKTKQVNETFKVARQEAPLQFMEERLD